MPRQVTRRAVLGGLAAAGAVAAAPGGRATATGMPPGHVVLLALDGFDADYLDGRVPMPNLARLAQRGSIARSTGVMSPVTNPSWTSLSCGTWPDRTRNAAYWFDEVAGVARGQSRDSAVEGLGQALRRQGRTIGSAQWFILQGKGVDYGDPQGLYTQPGGRIDARVDDAVAMLLGRPVRSGSTTVTLTSPPDFLAVYSSDLDGDGHTYGPDSPEVLSALRETDAAIGRLVQATRDAGIFGRTTWVVTGDHGMSEWRLHRGPQAQEAVTRAGYVTEVINSGQRPTLPGVQVVIVTGGSSSVHLLGRLKDDPDAVTRVRQALLGVEGVSAVLDKAEQRALRMAPQYGELVVETREPYSLFLTPPVGTDGLHGGRNDRSVPLLLSGHRVRANAEPTQPRHVDIAPTVAALLQVDPPAAAEGRVLSEALLDA